MNIIQAKVTGNKLEINSPYLTTDNVATVGCRFEFDGIWDGFDRIAVFGNGKLTDRYAVDVPADGLCVVPWEALEDDGKLLIGVYGIRGTDRITTQLGQATLTDSCYVAGEAPQEPTPDLYQQWIDYVITATTDAMDYADTVLAGANTAKTAAQTAQSKAEAARIGAEAAEQRAYDYVNIVDGGRPGQTRKLIADGGRPGGM